jgi:hypothetical protein
MGKLFGIELDTSSAIIFILLGIITLLLASYIFYYSYLYYRHFLGKETLIG